MPIQHYDADERDLRARHGLTIALALLVMVAGYLWVTVVAPLIARLGAVRVTR